MRKRQIGIPRVALCALFSVTLLVLPSVVPANEPTGDQALQDKLVAIEREFWRALQARDAESMKKTFAEDSVWSSPSGIHEDGAGFIIKVMNQFTIEKWSIGTATVRKAGRDAAVLVYELNIGFTGRPPWEKPWPMVTTFVNQGGKWLVLARAEVQSRQTAPPQKPSGPGR